MAIAIDPFDNPDGPSGGGGGGGTFIPPEPTVPSAPHIPPPTDTHPSIPTTPTAPPVPPDDVVTIPVGTVPPTRPVVHLVNGISLSHNAFGRTYVKGSQTTPETGTLTITNKFTDLDVNVALKGLAGVTFSPQTFDLLRGTTVSVSVQFDPSELEFLPEGMNVVNAVVSLASNLATWRPVKIDDPKLTLPPEQIPPIIYEPPTPSIPVIPPAVPFVPPVIYPPVTPPPQPTWVNGVDGQTNVGQPPLGWIQYPVNTGAWYPSDWIFDSGRPTPPSQPKEIQPPRRIRPRPEFDVNLE